MYKREKKSWLKHLDFTILDIVCLEASLVIAYLLRFGWYMPYAREPYERLAVIVVLIDICVVFFFEPYNGILRRGHFQEANACITFCTIIFAGVLAYEVATKQTEIYSRKVIYAYWLISMALVFTERFVVKHIIRQRMRNEKNLSVMILLTTAEYAKEVLLEFEHLQYCDFTVSGVIVVDQNLKGVKICGVPVVANADDCFDYLRTHVVDEVFINGNTRESSQALANELLGMGLTVHYNLVHMNALAPNKAVEKYGNYLVLTSSMKIASPRQVFAKRLMDIAGSAVGLIACGIAFVIFAPLIKIQSPGPIFFSQIRMGKNGRKFKIYKFRSMNVDAEAQKASLMAQNEMSGFMFKMENDPRIFPIGRVMRKFSIDELPQFFNVLKGDMSLVGTRPPTVEEFEQYELHHKARLGIKPGITGMWQVSGRSAIKDFEEVVALDTHYISQWSIGLDFKILFKTLQVVVTGKGSE
ncbi:MAG: sugar transferase [Eubacterium sp.]|jgi:exopolysaccharide biosynthesis polyprenyl glycosylphosphotransferase|nr:sugar transferase [Eubacterium sp.]NBI86021.1 sugar transferase [Lachnospiraceae bacterium]